MGNDGHWSRVAVLCCCLLVGLAALATPAAAGDGTVVVSVEPNELEAAAGEEVDLQLRVAGDGDLHQNGYYRISATVSYDPDVFEVVAADHGPFLVDGDDDVTVEGDIDVDQAAGEITIDQERVPPGDGALGSDATLELTLAIDDDVGPTSEPIEISDESVTLVVDDFRSSTVAFDGTVHVEGGDPDADDGADEGAPDGVTFADEPPVGDEDTASDGADDTSTSESDDDSIPGFAIPVAIGALVLAIGGRLVAGETGRNANVDTRSSRSQG